MNHKVGRKARSGRHARNPLPHGDHRKRPSYSRVGRLLKQRMALLFAPTIDDFEIDRPRLGLSERQVASHQRPQGDVVVVCVNRASAVQPASPPTHQEVPR